MSVEILAPAGNAECFKVAVNSGANAIYIGLDEFSARKNAENFCVANLEEYVRLAHLFDVKVYVAVNTLVKDCELDSFYNVIKEAYKCGVDAFILQDMFFGKALKKAIPEICLHLSTQAGVCNEYGAMLAKEYGFDRVILARETKLEDIKKITKIIETEVFVQGALCSAFSGHCYMSSFVGGLSGNRGQCKQPCRKKYIYSGEGVKSFKGYNLSLSDLCLKNRIKELVDAGVSSFKIEGRMRSPEYVHSSVKVYRDAILEQKNNENFSKLKTSFNRGEFTEGYINTNLSNILSRKIQGNIGNFIGKIVACSKNYVQVRTNLKFTSGDGFKVLRNGFEVGGGIFAKQEDNLLYISTNDKLAVGDEVRITKDASLYLDAINEKRMLDVEVKLYFYNNMQSKCVLLCKNKKFDVVLDEILTEAKNSPLSLEEVEKCFQKTDDYPFAPKITVEYLDNVFIQKSKLNAFRRKCYSVLHEGLSCSKVGSCADENPLNIKLTSNIKNVKNTVIISDFANNSRCKFERIVVKPAKYKDTQRVKEFLSSISCEQAFLYLPPYASNEDLKVFSNIIDLFDGVYAEGYYGIAFAREYNKKIMFGTGINIFNSFDINEINLIKESDGFVFSKELSGREIKNINANGSVLSLGCVQVMDLIYCPFSKDCANCRRGDVYVLEDEDGRKYTVRRYKTSECRFEVYNPYDLISENDYECNLFDFSIYNAEMCEKLYNDKKNAKKFISNYTTGNLSKGIK